MNELGIIAFVSNKIKCSSIRHFTEPKIKCTISHFGGIRDSCGCTWLRAKSPKINLVCAGVFPIDRQTSMFLAKSMDEEDRQRG
jgi:hypothetical protein